MAGERVVVVTGAGRGLGYEYASMFSDEGWRVALADIDAEAVKEAAKRINEDGGETIGVPVDVTDEDATLAMAQRVADEWGRIDALVNNAAVWGDLDPAPATEVDPAHWDQVISVNLKGPLLCARAVLPHMRTQGWGRIVNISSMGAYMPGGVYNTSKMGLNHLTLTLAVEAGDGITVNAVAPGPIQNEATRRQVPTEAFENLVQRCIIKRPGEARDVFAAIRYFVSDDADYVTAQTLLVNGGYNTRF